MERRRSDTFYVAVQLIKLYRIWQKVQKIRVILQNIIRNLAKISSIY